MSGGQGYSSLVPLLGDAGRVALYASSGRSGLVDPFTSFAGSATATATLDLNVNDNSVGVLPPIVLSGFVTPAGAISALMVGDKLSSATTGQIELLAPGDAATSASAPYFEIFIDNASTNEISLDFSYLLTGGGETLGTISAADNTGFGDTPASVGASKYNGVNFGQSIATSGAFSDLYNGDSYNRTYNGNLIVRIDPLSQNVIDFYNTQYASGLIETAPASVPDPRLIGIGLLGLGAMRRRRYERTPPPYFPATASS